MARSSPQSDGRKANAAQPPGERPGLVSKSGTERTGKASRQAAGPDGPDAHQASAMMQKAQPSRRKPQV